MNKAGLNNILERIQDAKVAVYGDFCLDVYWIMDEEGSEVSVETGLQAQSVAGQKYSPGGAGNVVSNLLALKPAEIRAIGVVGNDVFGRELVGQLSADGVKTDTLIVQNENFATYTYIKKYNGDVEEPRIDFGLKNARTHETDDTILNNIESALKNYDVLIFNQQVEGSLNNPEFIEGANKLFKKYNDKIIIVDSRHYNRKFLEVYRKVNEIEAAILLGGDAKPSDFISFEESKNNAVKLHQNTTKPVFLTSGNRGVLICDNKGLRHVPSLNITNKIDTVGAGDTTISALAMCLAVGVEHTRATEFAVLAAGVTIQKLFTTGTASAEEITEINKIGDYLFNTELAGDNRNAKFHDASEIEIVENDVFEELHGIKHAVFDHDGTISTLREGWEHVMEPVMIEAILGDKINSVDAKTYSEIKQRSLEFIDATTGIQTILQMEGLVKIVKEYGYVEDVKDKFQYKEIYNDALMEMVNKRIEKLNNKELSNDDFLMKGILNFMHRLKKRGVKLYLASGTDVDDVKNEAGVMGYADLFDGGIYGSVGDVSKYSKKMVINDILKNNNLKGSELLVVGDGPVEIRECRKVGGTAVGIASDEIRRYGINISKRTRLIKAGAQYIIPDFSQESILFDILFEGKSVMS
ncbi:MAG: PfkB family carbohydrate kinase [Bacteroidota bacterium]